MSERDQLLEHLLSGEADPADPAVQQLFERDPAARAEYESLRGLERSLERQGDRTRELIEASQRLPSRGDAQQVLATLTRLAEQEPSVRALPTRKRWNPGWLALAAALIAALAWAWWARSPKPAPEQEILLGPETPWSTTAIALKSPIGAVKQYLPFEWTGELRAGCWFEVEVFDPERPDDPILRSGTVLGNRWIPNRPPADWPARIVWTLTPNDSGGAGQSVSAEAWLQP